MTTEKLTVETLADVEHIGHGFTREVGYPGGFSFPAFAKLWGPLLGMDMGVIFVVRDENRVIATLGATFIEDGFNGRRVACENFWFVLPEYRKAGLSNLLFDAYENEANARGCRKLLIAHLDTPQAKMLEGIYLKRGFSPIEKTFAKEI